MYTKKLQDPIEHLQDRPGQPKQIPGNAADDPAELQKIFRRISSYFPPGRRKEVFVVVSPIGAVESSLSWLYRQHSVIRRLRPLAATTRRHPKNICYNRFLLVIAILYNRIPTLCNNYLSSKFRRLAVMKNFYNFQLQIFKIFWTPIFINNFKMFFSAAILDYQADGGYAEITNFGNVEQFIKDFTNF